MSLIFDKIKSFQEKNSDQDSAVRSIALGKLQEVGFPHRRVEAWKYTNITERLDKDFVELSGKAFELNLPFKCEVIQVSNGVVAQNEYTSSLSLKELDDSIDDTDAMYLYAISTSTSSNTISFKKSLSSPVVIYHKNDASTQGKNISKQFKIVVEKDVKVEILEVFENESASFETNIQKIFVEENAKLFHNVITLATDQNTAHFYTSTELKRNAEYHNVKILLKNGLVRNEVKILLKEEGAHAEVHGLYALSDSEHADTYTLVHHQAPHTTSNQLYKGVMAKESRGVFTGLVKVDKKAQLINSSQLNKNLLLSKKAHANSRPQLEIFADDVKCSHGSTTGQISPEELFYFISRGIKPEKAKRMLSQAFAYDIIYKIENPEIRQYAENLFKANYHGLEEA